MSHSKTMSRTIPAGDSDAMATTPGLTAASTEPAAPYQAAEERHPLTSVTRVRTENGVQQRLNAGISAWATLAEALATPELVRQVNQAGSALVAALASGGKVMVAGNGGSAAIASHIAAEFLGKCVHDRSPLPAINLAESLSSLTAIANDYGYEHVFERGIKAFGQPGDVYLAMSTSGTSPNVVRSLKLAQASGLVTIAMTGESGEGLREDVDHLLVVPSCETPRIQEVHMLWAHTWCEAVDDLSQRE